MIKRQEGGRKTEVTNDAAVSESSCSWLWFSVVEASKI